MTTNVQAINEVDWHVQEEGPVFVNFTNWLHSTETIVSATVASADTTLVLGAPVVFTEETTEDDHEFVAQTIAIGKGLKFQTSGGTAGDQIITCVATTSEGRVRARDLVLKVAGTSA